MCVYLLMLQKDWQMERNIMREGISKCRLNARVKIIQAWYALRAYGF